MVEIFQSSLLKGAKFIIIKFEYMYKAVNTEKKSLKTIKLGLICEHGNINDNIKVKYCR